MKNRPVKPNWRPVPSLGTWSLGLLDGRCSPAFWPPLWTQHPFLTKKINIHVVSVLFPVSLALIHPYHLNSYHFFPIFSCFFSCCFKLSTFLPLFSSAPHPSGLVAEALLAAAQGSEVLGRLRHHIAPEHHDHSTGLALAVGLVLVCCRFGVAGVACVGHFVVWFSWFGWSGWCWVVGLVGVVLDGFSVLVLRLLGPFSWFWFGIEVFFWLAGWLVGVLVLVLGPQVAQFLFCLGGRVSFFGKGCRFLFLRKSLGQAPTSRSLFLVGELLCLVQKKHVGQNFPVWGLPIVLSSNC